MLWARMTPYLSKPSLSRASGFAIDQERKSQVCHGIEMPPPLTPRQKVQAKGQCALLLDLHRMLCSLVFIAEAGLRAAFCRAATPQEGAAGPQ